jgi:hypothetical protein
VSDHACGPTAAGVAAETALKARADVAKRDAFAITKIAAGARGAYGVDAASDATKYWFDDNAAGGHSFELVREVSNDFVARNERKRNDWFEKARTVAVDGCEVGTTDAGEARKNFNPTRPRQCRSVDIA